MNVQLPMPPRELLPEFRRRGAVGKVWLAESTSPDEAIFILSRTDAAAVDANELAEHLQELLSRKVWVTVEGPAWQGQMRELGTMASREPQRGGGGAPSKAQTLSARFEIYSAPDGYRWRLVKGNREVAASRQAYRRRGNAARAVDQLRSLAATAGVRSG